MSERPEENPAKKPMRKVDLRRNRHAPAVPREDQPDPMDELLDASGDEEFPDEPSERE